MSAPVYATVDDLAQYMDADLPANGKAYLRVASNRVREYTETSWYATDPATGLPTDQGYIDAFNEATCAHAAAMITLGIDPFAGGAESAGVEESVGLGTAKVTYADAADVVALRRHVLYYLAPEAVRVIANARIAVNVPWVLG